MLKRKSYGGTVVDFTFVAGIFFMILFAVVEFGRILYTWNVLDEVTRRAARLAAVCPIEDAAGIFSRATFNGDVVTNLQPSNLKIDYLNESSVVIPDTTVNFTDIRFVRASIEDFQYQMSIPLVNILSLQAPSFTTVLPSESLGVIPPGAGNPPSC